MNRREFLRFSGTVAAGALIGSSLWKEALADCVPAMGGAGPYGPLLSADVNGIMLPAGFTSRVVARSNQVVAGTSHSWHIFPDGGATFRVGGGWIYVSNSEAVGPVSVGAIRFDRDGNIVDAYPILMNTVLNCAGGATPWGTWLSCEEHDNGYAWECDPSGETPGIRRDAMGKFKHEAAVVDRRQRMLYLSEDHSDGCFYRFKPDSWRDLSAGVLEVAVVDVDGFVDWLPVPDPSATSTPTRHQVAEATTFNGGEGLAYHRGHVYLATKGDNRIWDYDTRRGLITVLYEAGLDPVHQLTGVDNITSSRRGDLIVAEDGGNMELVLISPDRVVSPLLRVVGQDSSELTGPAFDPRRGDRLYFSSQRGDSFGITYEVTGPFRRATPRRIVCA